MNVVITTEKAHPFELAGMGTGPFRFVGLAVIPSTAIAEQNPEAYNRALAMLPRNLVNGCGSCANCGMAIMNICIVENASGARYGVGSDCIAKVGDPCLGNAAKVAVARLQARQRAARKEAQRIARHNAWLAAADANGETNAQRLAREQAEREQAALERKAAVFAQWGFMVPFLSGPEGSFCDSISRGIKNGSEPRGRAVEILQDIYASSFGRRGSKAYNAACDEFNTRFEPEA